MSKLIKESVEKLIQEIERSPRKAKVGFESSSVLKDSVRVESTVRQFTFHADEAENTGGTDSAPNPLEYVLASLGACQAITYKALASLKGVQIDSVEVKVKGYTDLNGFLGLNKETRPGYLKVEVDAVVESKEDPKVLEALYQQVEAICPVLDIFANANKVTGKVTVHKTQELVA
ncbi:OsmC family protein [Arenibacter certesii]|uniref:OsmC family peroxiredoxin n=1 Tax=Arenibacter certesii TaxID=228955 RepID=A0A918J5K9_9FLAO|nr:OsmC family protein [Arenibacter certesii]GGW49653.1 hypothetical protein GCM10007383_36910 [Arenibacter certesii]